MYARTPLLTILLSLCVIVAAAGQSLPGLSNPLYISMKGWNKVLYLRDGHTILFHIEPNLPITTILFDSSQRQVATHTDHSTILDNFAYNPPSFKGLYEINGEAVLFLEQERQGRQRLVRLRYNAQTGSLTGESLIGESKGPAKPIQFYVMKEKSEEGYQVFFCTDISHPVKTSDLFVVYFSKFHEALKEVQLPVNRSNYDDLNIVGAQVQPQGTLITIGLDKVVTYGGATNEVNLPHGASELEHFIAFYFIPKDSIKPMYKFLALTERLYPKFDLFTFNPFAQAINAIVFTRRTFIRPNGLGRLETKVDSTYFFRLAGQDLEAGINHLTYHLANTSLHQQTDTNHAINGLPMKCVTNANGLTSIISFDYVRQNDERTLAGTDTSYMSFKIGFTQLDDEGREVWGVALPGPSLYLRVRSSDLYFSSFTSLQAYERNGDYFVIYNDYDENVGKSFRDAKMPVASFEATNARYYKISNKRQIYSGYLFGAPGHNEYRNCYTNAACFDEQTGVYASLVRYKHGDNISLRMAWTRL